MVARICNPALGLEETKFLRILTTISDESMNEEEYQQKLFLARVSLGKQYMNIFYHEERQV